MGAPSEVGGSQAEFASMHNRDSAPNLGPKADTEVCDFKLAV
jgi:hypothetical protein